MTDSKTTKRLLFVVCMHRSGSSAWTHGLELLGATIGDKPMPPVPGNNDKGFFEDIELSQLSDRVLAELNTRWDRLGPVDERRLTRPELAPLRFEAFQLLKEKVGEQSLLAFKNPRNSLLLPFWQSVIADLGWDTKYLITVRSPLDVAWSLQKRDGFPLTKGVLLWAKYMVAAIENLHRKPVIVASYDALLENPFEQLKRVAGFLNVSEPEEESAEFTAYKDQFLDPALRHSQTGSGELRRSGRVPNHVLELYEILLRLSQGEPLSSFELDEWPALQQQQTGIVSAMSMLDQQEKEIADLQHQALKSAQKIDELHKQRDHERGAKEDRERRVVELKKVLGEKDRLIAHKNLEISKAGEQIKQREQKIQAQTTDTRLLRHQLWQREQSQAWTSPFRKAAKISVMDRKI